MNTLPQTPRLLTVTDGHTTIGYAKNALAELVTSRGRSS
jgi:hypothetical protein